MTVSIYTVKKGIAYTLLCFGLLACQANSKDHTTPTARLNETTPHMHKEAPRDTQALYSVTTQENEPVEPDKMRDADFISILKSYQDLNTRLENISAPLLLNNTALCPKTRRDPGFTVHTIRDYPENLQAIARILLPVSDTLSIRTVRKDSPAEHAALQPGDILQKIGISALASGPTARQMYGWVTKTAYQKDNLDLSLIRNGTSFSVQIQPQTICDYPISIFFSNQINGHSDGTEVWITSELMRREDNDNNLALIIAHELAHNIHGDTDFESQKSRELIADRMALVLMQRAGYDIHRVLSDWSHMHHPHMNLQDRSNTHPTLKDRLDNFQKEAARIQAQLDQGFTPIFDN